MGPKTCEWLPVSHCIKRSMDCWLLHSLVMMETNVTTTATVVETQSAHLPIFIYVTDGLLTNILVVAGLIANALTLAVLSRPSMHSSTNSYLSALAVCDSVVLTCSALLIGLPALPLHLISYYVHGGPFAYILAYVYPLALVAQTATVWLTVSFSVERYIGVQYPLRAASICTVERARSAIILAVRAVNAKFHYTSLPVAWSVTSWHQVGHFPVYGEATGKRV